MLFLAPAPLLLGALGAIRRGNATESTVELLAFAGLMLSAWLVNEGQRAEQEYEARSIARPPAIPRKLFAAILSGACVAAVSALSLGQGVAAGAVFGLITAGAHVVAFGLDPMKRKGAEGISQFEADRVARAIQSAEATVAEILSAARGIGDRRLEGRVERMVAHVREVFRAVEEDPRDLTRARRFLGVYLLGARDATRKFATLYARDRNEQARIEYESLLDDLEASFRQHRDDLLKDDKVALDIEIEVLRERLQREGV